MSDIVKSKDYLDFVKEITEQIYKSQYEALKVVNKELINLYWSIGKAITEKQDNHGWGKSVVEILSKDLQSEFPGIQGFSSRNLWYMRNFYYSYSENAKLQPMVAEISWTKNIVILEKCKDDLQREFYIKMTKKYGWTKNVLIHQIDNQSYEKYLLNQTNFDKTLPEKYRNQAKLAVKDEYSFDFLEFSEEHSERELEIGLINNIRKFLVEMGGGFSFIGNQYRLEVDDTEYFIDLLLYHRELKSLVAIELKIGEFKPEYAGKMQFYLTALDDLVKLEEENPSIGIIVCRSKKRTTVEYALKKSAVPIGVSTYTISESLPEDLKKYLPEAEQIAEKLSLLDL